MHDPSPQACLEQQLERHLEQACLGMRLDDQLGTHHGLSWSDFVLLSVLDGAGGAMSLPELAGRLGLTRFRLLQQLLPLEKTGLVARHAAPGGNSGVTLCSGGLRLLREAHDTAGAVCVEACRPCGARSAR